MDPLHADLNLAEASAARERGLRFARAQMAQPLTALAFAWLALCPIALLIGRNHLAPFVALSLVTVSVLAWFRFRESAAVLGVRGRLWPWLVVALVAQFGGMAASITGTERHLSWLNAGGPFILNAAALLLVAWILESRAIAEGVALMAGTTVVTCMFVTGNAAVATQLAAYALILLATRARLMP